MGRVARRGQRSRSHWGPCRIFALTVSKHRSRERPTFLFFPTMSGGKAARSHVGHAATGRKGVPLPLPHGRRRLLRSALRNKGSTRKKRENDLSTVWTGGGGGRGERAAQCRPRARARVPCRPTAPQGERRRRRPVKEKRGIKYGGGDGRPRDRARPNAGNDDRLVDEATGVVETRSGRGILLAPRRLRATRTQRRQGQPWVRTSPPPTQR